MGTFDDIIIQDEKERLFTAYATVEIKDKQGQFVPLSNFKKAFYKFMSRGASLNWMHTNRTIGKVLNGEEEQLGDYKAFKITAMIYGHDDEIKEYDEAWEAIKSGQATGVSIGGGQPLLITKQSKDGQVDELVTVPLLEISVVDKPANPLALITGFSMAKSDGSTDIISINVPAITRLFEYALESKLDDVALHKMLERLIEASKNGTLTMDSYNFITAENLEKSEANTMDNEVPKASEQIDLAKTLNSLNETISKMYSMVEKALAKTEVSAPEEVKENVEEVKEDAKEEGKPEIAQEAKEEGETPEQEAKEEELEKAEEQKEDKPETEAEPKDISEEVSTEKEGEDMEKADNGKITELEQKVAELQKQLAGNIQKSVTTVAPNVQPEGAMNSNPGFVWDYVKKEKGL